MGYSFVLSKRDKTRIDSYKGKPLMCQFCGEELLKGDVVVHYGKNYLHTACDERRRY